MGQEKNSAGSVEPQLKRRTRDSATKKKVGVRVPEDILQIRDLCLSICRFPKLEVHPVIIQVDDDHFSIEISMIWGIPH